MWDDEVDGPLTCLNHRRGCIVHDRGAALRSCRQRTCDGLFGAWIGDGLLRMAVCHRIELKVLVCVWCVGVCVVPELA